MFKTLNEKVVYGILSFVFAVIMVVLILDNRNIIDIIYLGIVSILILRFMLVKIRK